MVPGAGPNTLSIGELNELIKTWEDSIRDTNWDPTPTIKRIAELVEEENNNYLKTDPDPFDERHPTRVNPLCTLGQLFKIICKKDNFMDKLVLDYTRENYWLRSAGITRDPTDLNTHAARLLLDIMAGLETSVVFQDAENLIWRLYGWAESAGEPLRSYATGLLAAAMEVQDIAGNFRDSNARLVPIMMQRLKTLQAETMGVSDPADAKASRVPDRPFAHISSAAAARLHDSKDSVLDDDPKQRKLGPSSGSTVTSPADFPPPRGTVGLAPENSNSSWAELRPQLIGTFQVHPLTPATQQILLLRYFTPLGEYQEWLGHVFEQDMMSAVFRYINFRYNQDARLTFEALKYLSALLCHKKFTLEFLSRGGLELLLEIPRPGIAATGASMCLYYLAYSEDAMERICQLPETVIVKLVRYALWLLECSHESGRCHATMCFGLNFQFRPILEQFDRQDGLRKLLNVVGTLRMITTGNVDTFDENDDEFTARQTMRHVCFTLKCYLEAELVLKAEELKRGSLDDRSPPTTAGHLSLKVTPEAVQENMETMMSLMPLRARWRPVNTLFKLGGIRTLLQIIDISQDINYSGKSETIRSALDAINICAVLPAVQLQLCERQSFPGGRSLVGMGLVVAMAEMENMGDPEVQKSAIRVIITCVCGPLHRPGSAAASALPASAKKRALRPYDDLLPTMWEAVRTNNGIMALMALLQAKTPITDADSVRALACRALVGLARSEVARQIMSKLPLFTTSQLQMVIREPILQEKRSEHVQLQRDALELVELVSGKSKRLPGADTDITMDTIHRANVVAQTRIHYNEKQLLQLMHNHLVSKGLTDTALMLQVEAGLPSTSSKMSMGVPAPPRLTAAPPLTPRQGRTSTAGGRLSAAGDGQTATPHRPPPTTPAGRGGPPPGGGVGTTGPTATTITSTTISTSTSTAVGTPLAQPLHIRVSHLRTDRRIESAVSPAVPTTSRPARQKSSVDAAQFKLERPCSTAAGDPITLDRVVTEYLMNQHALCRNPMVTCPQFDLFEPHRCPEPKSKHSAPANLTQRLARRAVFAPHGGPDGRRLDARLIYSRYCPVRTFRELGDEDTTLFTCATFTPGDMKYMMIGTHDGTVKAFNLDTGEVDETYASLHASSITHLEVNRTGNHMLTSSRRRRPLSALWSIENVFESMVSFAEDEYVEFSKLSQNRVLGTQRTTGTSNFTANVYDITTGQRVTQLIPRDGNGYQANRATFDPTDELVLNNGVLFDVRAPREVHKFDKFNNTISGVFHPNGLEIVANTEVWDMRTFHLLRTVPALQQCRLRFASGGHVMFGVRLSGSERDSDEHPFEEVTAFKVIDAVDYTSIATVDVKRHVYDLCVNFDDRLVGLVESQLEMGDVELDQSCVRLYEVGRIRGDEDLDDQEEEDNVDDTDGSDISDNVASDIASFLNIGRRRNRNINSINGDVSDSDMTFVASDTDGEASSGSHSERSAASAAGDDSNGSWVTEEEQVDADAPDRWEDQW